MLMVTAATLDSIDPSYGLCVHLSLHAFPTRRSSDLEPSALRVNDAACSGELTRTAVRVGLSTSVSLERKSTALTLSEPLSLTAYASLLAIGASSTEVTLMVEVATLLRLFTPAPSLTCHDTVRGVVDGLSEVLAYFTVRSAAW